MTMFKPSGTHADHGSVAAGRDIRDAIINVGIPPDLLQALIRQHAEHSETQNKLISELESKLDLNQRQVRAALDILGERDVAPERLAAKLVEIAERFKVLQATALARPGDDAKIAALKAEAQKAIDAGELAKADTLLAEVEAEQRRMLGRLAVNAADTSARRGDIALARLRYSEAANHFANAAAAGRIRRQRRTAFGDPAQKVATQSHHPRAGAARLGNDPEQSRQFVADARRA
jgi:hypothetical protein